jgi:hypothetical protein
VKRGKILFDELCSKKFPRSNSFVHFLFFNL